MFQLSELRIARGSRKRASSCVISAEYGVERLEERVALSATPVAADMNPKSGFGLTQIVVDGQNLLEGNGFHIIGGQKPNLDVLANQINSEHASANGKKMYLGDDPKSSVTMPYTFELKKVANDKSKVDFSVSVGKSDTNFDTISIPVKGYNRHFEYWRASTDTQLKRFDQNPVDPKYVGGIGKYGISNAPAGGNGTWAEMIGTKYTIRVTITSSSRPMTPFFVNAPELGKGVRDVEFSFGPVAANTAASVKGFIQVFRTDQSLLPASSQPISTIRLQAESSNFAHDIGRVEGNAYSVRVGDTANRYMAYGPSQLNLIAGDKSATFRLKLDNVTADNNKTLRIEVIDRGTGKAVKTQDLKRKDFKTANTYQDFTLNFRATAGAQYEFRVFWYGGSYAALDYVDIK